MIVRCDQSISPQPGSRPCPRRRHMATSAVTESAPSGNASPPVLTAADHGHSSAPADGCLRAVDCSARRRPPLSMSQNDATGRGRRCRSCRPPSGISNTSLLVHTAIGRHDHDEAVRPASARRPAEHAPSTFLHVTSAAPDVFYPSRTSETRT